MLTDSESDTLNVGSFIKTIQQGGDISQLQHQSYNMSNNMKLFLFFGVLFSIYYYITINSKSKSNSNSNSNSKK